MWTIGGPKSRRRLEQGFLGAEKILENNGKLRPISRKRVGIMGMKMPARGHTEIFAAKVCYVVSYTVYLLLLL